MELNAYQDAACETAIYPDRHSFRGIIYCALKLNGEAGEFADKVGKIIRDDASEMSLEKHKALLLELGDILWYVTLAAGELGVTLETIANKNLDKLRSRKERGTLQGSGDGR